LEAGSTQESIPFITTKGIITGPILLKYGVMEICNAFAADLQWGPWAGGA